MAPEFRVAQPRVAAGVLITDDEGRVLLVKPVYKSGWDLPGGYVEPGETPKDGAIRELGEELGVQPVVGRLLVVDWAPHPDEGDKVLFIFEGAPVDLDDVQPQSEEIGIVEFVDIDELPNRLPERLLRRVTSALTATDPYLEHGQQLS